MGILGHFVSIFEQKINWKYTRNILFKYKGLTEKFQFLAKIMVVAPGSQTVTCCQLRYAHRYQEYVKLDWPFISASYVMAKNEANVLTRRKTLRNYTFSRRLATSIKPGFLKECIAHFLSYFPYFLWAYLSASSFPFVQLAIFFFHKGGTPGGA